MNLATRYAKKHIVNKFEDVESEEKPPRTVRRRA